MDLNKVKHHDMMKKPYHQNFFLRGLFFAATSITSIGHKLKVERIGMENLKEPHLILLNHSSICDLKTMVRLNSKQSFNYVISIDGFLDASFTHIQEFLMRHYGAITKRKFTNDIQLIKQIKHALFVNKQNVIMYPEARYTLAGFLSSTPDSLGKLVKILNVPVVTIRTLGNYISDPCWGDHSDRKAPLEARITYLLNKEQIASMDYQTINQTITNDLDYDDFVYQKEIGFLNKYKKRAEGLNHILYQCPNCHQEHEMYSETKFLWCEHCKKKWEFCEDGHLEALDGNNLFTTIHEWFEWQRTNVRAMIDKGEYYFKDEVMIYALPNVKKLIPVGIGTFEHSIENGYHLKGDFGDYHIDVVREPLSMYSCHVEFNLKKAGACLDVSTFNDTFFIRPLNYRDILTKFHFATEEIYKVHKERSENK